MKSKDSLIASLTSLLSPATPLLLDEPMARRTTLRVGGPADFYVEPGDELELSRLLQWADDEHLPVMVLGRGSNLLVRDGGIRGLVVSLSQPDFSRINFSGQEIFCGAGARLKNVAVEAKRAGIAGLEFLEGIPGSVGGALRMNAGAMGGWTFEIVQSVRCLTRTGEAVEIEPSSMGVGYRHCKILESHIAVSAVLKGFPGERALIEHKMKVSSQKRWSSQPAAPSAGCIFKNPPTIPSGRLIDEMGLKGSKLGGASISDVHGNFIVNDGGASASDVLGLISMIKARALAERGLVLETEVQIVGVDQL